MKSYILNNVCHSINDHLNLNTIVLGELHKSVGLPSYYQYIKPTHKQ